MELLVKPPAAHEFVYLIPEIVLTAWGLLVLIVDFSLLRDRPAARRRAILAALSLVGCLVVLATMAWPVPSWWPGGEIAPDSDPYLFWGTLAGDALTGSFNALLVGLLALVFALSLTSHFTEHWGEFFALLFWATVGMMLLIAAEELLLLFLTLETMTLCLYLTTAFEKGRRRSTEGALKYFVYGSVSSALFLFGLSLIYGLTGTTQLEGIRVALQGRGTATGLAGNVLGATAVLLVLVGFGFKVAAVPFHQWAPDAYEGAPAPVTAWIASGSKIASFVAMMKVLVHALGPWASPASSPLGPGWVGVVAVIAAASMTYGNLAGAGAAQLQAHAGLLVDRARRLPARRGPGRVGLRPAGRGGRLGPVLPGRLRLHDRRRLRPGRLAGPRQGRRRPGRPQRAGPAATRAGRLRRRADALADRHAPLRRVLRQALHVHGGAGDPRADARDPGGAGGPGPAQ
jgi:NADH:ubiquinone oxidoreductase subunit 2 (subunit N)